MVAFAKRYVGNEALAEDVVEELVQRWLERPPRIRDSERFSAFLAVSVYHAAIDWIRRDRAEQGRPPRREAQQDFTDRRRKSSIVQPGPRDSRASLQARLAAALERLADTDRLLLEAHYAQALTAEDCMGLLRINRDAFHKRLHRARTRLAHLLAAGASDPASSEEAR